MKAVYNFSIPDEEMQSVYSRNTWKLALAGVGEECLTIDMSEENGLCKGEKLFPVQNQEH